MPIFVGWVIKLEKGRSPVKYYTDVLLASACGNNWFLQETLRYYIHCQCKPLIRERMWKQLIFTRNTALLNSISMQTTFISRCVVALFPQTADRMFLECWASTLGCLSLTARVTLHSRRLGFLSLKGREPICLWRFNLEDSHTTPCGLFFQTAHCSHRQRAHQGFAPFWIW